MFKRIVSMVTFLILVFSVSTQAAEPRTIRVTPSLTFSGTTATCSVDCKSGNSSDEISATLTLYQGSTYVKSWSKSGTGKVSMSKTCTVKKGQEYKLVLSYSVNGKSMSSVTTIKKCP